MVWLSEKSINQDPYKNQQKNALKNGKKQRTIDLSQKESSKLSSSPGKKSSFKAKDSSIASKSIDSEKSKTSPKAKVVKM